MLAHIRQEESVDTAASSDRSIFNQLAARKRQSMARTRPQSANFRLRRGGDDDGESEGEGEGGGKKGGEGNEGGEHTATAVATTTRARARPSKLAALGREFSRQRLL